MFDRSGFVYVVQDGSGLCKIGRAKDVEKRIRSLSTGSSSALTLIASWPCEDAGAREADLHLEWSKERVRGEWFRIPENVVNGWRESSGTSMPRNPAKAPPRGEKPGTDGNWWICSGKQQIDCPQCGRATDDSPAVMRYVAESDWGGMQAKCHTAWPARGWVVWRQCEFCSWMDFKTEYVTTEQIVSWAVGPWKPMS